MKTVVKERDNGRRRVQIFTEGGSLTEQAHREECNINTIMQRYRRTGVLPQNPHLPVYGDFSQLGDYHACVTAVAMAQEGFMSLPSHLRKAFDNDPGKLLAFLDDPENREEAIELGLIAPDPPAESISKAPEAPSEGQTEPQGTPTPPPAG